MRRFSLTILLLLSSFAARGQSCTMCRDTTAGSAPRVQAGLRRAIPVLAVPAILLFGGFLVIARRTDRWQKPEGEKK
jgi:hypothetical protein